ncbi:sperm-specific protein Don juan-like isoform X1 [Bombina bombina]|uniref:sperm-specific protein Don juan-like isoform X1 n=1 Tax=Bombina bombina TaxID=8345 RepID=UPI00235A4D05|nr:sperm-specific protein Don juan-like isoform X1 [Bombina bombina]
MSGVKGGQSQCHQNVQCHDPCKDPCQKHDPCKDLCNDPCQKHDPCKDSCHPVQQHCQDHSQKCYKQEPKGPTVPYFAGQYRICIGSLPRI